jgi:hypothetical protein
VNIFLKPLLIFPLIFLVITSACGPTKELASTQTAQASTEIALDWTETPTPTSSATPTPTQTPTPTATQTQIPTPTPSPTPMGGGSGRLMFFHDLGIYAYEFASQNLETVVPQETLSEALGLEEVVSSRMLISPSGKYFYLMICQSIIPPCTQTRHFLASVDLSILMNINFRDISKSIEWSKDGRQILARIRPGDSVSNGYRIYLVNADENDFGSMTTLPMGFMAFLSLDGEVVYSSDRSGLNRIDLMSLEKQPISCAACEIDLIQYEGAISPDGQTVALVNRVGNVMEQDENGIPYFGDLISNLVLASHDFSSSQILASGIIGASEVKWSPDGSKLLIDVTKRDPNSDVANPTIIHEFLTINVDNGETNNYHSPAGSDFILPCGWSPDSRVFSYLASFPNPEGFSDFQLHLQALEMDDPIVFTTFESGRDWCPVWLPTEETSS